MKPDFDRRPEDVRPFCLFVDRLCERNKASKDNDSIFDLRCELNETVSLETYLTRCDKYMNPTKDFYIAALIYLKRVEESGLFVTVMNQHKLTCLALTMAVKFCVDVPQYNDYMAKVAGMGVSEFNELEHDFLRRIGWHLYVKDDEILLVNRLLSAGTVWPLPSAAAPDELVTEIPEIVLPTGKGAMVEDMPVRTACPSVEATPDTSTPFVSDTPSEETGSGSGVLQPTSAGLVPPRVKLALSSPMRLSTMVKERFAGMAKNVLGSAEAPRAVQHTALNVMQDNPDRQSLPATAAHLAQATMIDGLGALVVAEGDDTALVVEGRDASRDEPMVDPMMEG